MMEKYTPTADDSTDFEAVAGAHTNADFVLRLYVTGTERILLGLDLRQKDEKQNS